MDKSTISSWWTQRDRYQSVLRLLSFHSVTFLFLFFFFFFGIFRGIALFCSSVAKCCRLTSSTLCLSLGWVLHLPTDLLHRHQRLYPGLFSHIKQKVLFHKPTQILSDIHCIPAAVKTSFAFISFSFEVVQVIHEKLLDMVGKVQ